MATASNHQQTEETTARCGKLSDEERKERCREAQRRYRANNPEKVRERNRQYRANNLEKERERNRQYHANNLEKGREYRRQYHANNPEKVRERNRQYHANNPEKERERTRRYRANNPEKVREYIHRRRARKAGAISPAFPKVTSAAIRQRIRLFGNACAYCGGDGPFHIDHVEPLVSGGLHTPANLVPACARCNCSKNDRPVEAWYLTQPFFSPRRWKALQAHTGRQWSPLEQLPLFA